MIWSQMCNTFTPGEIYIYARWRIYVSADRAIIHVGYDPLHVEA